MSVNADEPKRKRQKRLSDFFSVPGSIPLETNKEPCDESQKESTDEAPKSPKEDLTGNGKQQRAKREFNSVWLKKNPWLQFETNKMTCKVCVSEGKANCSLCFSTLVKLLGIMYPLLMRLNLC